MLLVDGHCNQLHESLANTPPNLTPKIICYGLHEGDTGS